MSELPFSRQEMAELMRLARTDAGRQLMDYVQKNNGPALHAAMDQASAGNYEEAKRIAREILSSPEAAALLRQLGR